MTITTRGYTRLALAATLGLATASPALATEDSQTWTNEALNPEAIR
jgi:hypothetical protein